MPLRDAAFYDRSGTDLRTGAEVGALDLQARSVVLKDGVGLPFDALILATGAEPIRPPIPCSAGPTSMFFGRWRTARRSSAPRGQDAGR